MVIRESQGAVRGLQPSPTPMGKKRVRGSVTELRGGAWRAAWWIIVVQELAHALGADIILAHKLSSPGHTEVKDL